MTRSLMTACLAAAIVGIATTTCRADGINLNFSEIKWEYIKQSDSGITFGGGSTFPPLPADFFDPGSLPFDGLVRLQGAPGLDAVILRRNAGGLFPDPPAPIDIPIEIIALNLVSVEPIVVTYSGGATEQWNVQVNLNPRETGDGAFRIAHNGPATRTEERSCRRTASSTCSRRLGSLADQGTSSSRLSTDRSSTSSPNGAT